MSSTQGFFYIGLPVLVLLIGFFIYSFHRLYFRYYRNKVVSTIAINIRRERLLKIEADISRINLIAKSNPKYKDNFVELKKLFDQILSLLEIVEKQFRDLSEKRMTARGGEFLKLRLISTQSIAELDVVDASFDKIAQEVINQDGFLRSEFTLYQGILRTTMRIYVDKKPLINKISAKLDLYLSDAKELERKFENFLSKGELDNSSSELKNYSQLVTKFVELIDEGPSIQTYLFASVPRLMEGLKTLYEQKVVSIPSLQKTNSYQSLTDQVKPRALHAIQAYKDLNVTDAKQEIQEIIKLVKHEESQIKAEVKSKQELDEIYPKIVHNYQVVFQNNAELVQKWQEAKDREYNLPDNLKDEFKKLNDTLNDVKDKREKLDLIIKNEDLTFTSKVARCKMVVQSLIEVFYKMNKINEVLWLASTELSLMKRKLRRIQSAINEISANTKNQRLKMSLDDEQQLQRIVQQFDNLSKKITNDRVDRDLVVEINLLENQTLDFYRIVIQWMKEEQMASNLIRELTPQRAFNQELDLVIKQMQHYYLQRKYYEAVLHLIIFYETAKRKDFKLKRLT